MDKKVPRLGNLGRAILKASNDLGSNSWLKPYWDNYFKNLRKQRKNNKRNEQKNTKRNV